MNDRFNIRYFNKNTKEFEYLKIGAVNFNLFTDWTVYEQGQFCTGLKDKNGTLIYEGDIIKFGEFYDDKWHSWDIGKVYWGGKFDYPAFEIQSKATDFDTSNGLSYIFGEGLSIEVIGNLYQNPELLQEG